MTYLKQITWAVIFGIFAGPSVWAQGGGHKMVTPGELKWVDVPSLPPGGKLAVIEGPLNETVPFTFRLQFPARTTGTRTVLVTPLLRESVPIGVILIRRTEVRPFSDKQIALLKTFADQAVIAIENVRLFQELQERTRELVRSVGELKALGEVGQAVSSTLDLETVLTRIVS